MGSLPLPSLAGRVGPFSAEPWLHADRSGRVVLVDPGDGWQRLDDHLETMAVNADSASTPHL